MANNLDDVKRSLYDAFERAIGKSKMSTSSLDGNTEAAKNQAAAAYLQAAAQTAEAIAKVEREITMRDIIKDLRAQGADIEVDFEKGTVRSMSPMSKIKLKAPGEA
jgi:hypothetical protein